MPLCPACARPVAVARPRCLWCGAELPAEFGSDAEQSAREITRAPVAAAAETETETAARRLLLVLELGGTAPDVLARPLGLSLFEAKQRAARGGFELLRTVPGTQAEELAATLRKAGLTVFLIPEAEARRAPTTVRGGGFEDGLLRLRTEKGEAALGREDLLLVVRGPIAREYQTPAALPRFRTASLTGGYRVHLHLRRDEPPLELDPGNFEFGFTSRQSSLLELGLWLESLGAPTDDTFKKLAPALAPAAKEGTGVTAATRALVRTAGEGALVLDNVGQFRLYSGWRGAVERRRG